MVAFGACVCVRLCKMYVEHRIFGAVKKEYQTCRVTRTEHAWTRQGRAAARRGPLQAREMMRKARFLSHAVGAWLVSAVTLMFLSDVCNPSLCRLTRPT